MPKKVIVYSTENCPYCKMAKQFLDQNKIAYTSIDVGKDQKAAEQMVEKSGQLGVPVIEVDGTILIGFDRDALKEALGIQ